MDTLSRLSHDSDSEVAMVCSLICTVCPGGFIVAKHLICGSLPRVMWFVRSAI